MEFLKGSIEAIPLPDDSVDVIISNCVINLAADKDAALREAFRVLKPGGRFAVSDVVVHGDVPPEVRRNMELWVGCVAGRAARLRVSRTSCTAAGFTDVSVEPWREYSLDDARTFLAAGGLDVDALAAQVEGKIASAFIRAQKPVAGTLLRHRTAATNTGSWTRVIFACVHNAGRSQMAAAWFNALADPAKAARRVGGHPAR